MLLRVPESVGPKYRIPATPKFADNAGRIRPIPMNNKIPEFKNWLGFRNQGAANQKQIAEVAMPMAVPLRGSMVVRPMACNWLPMAKMKAANRAKA